MELISRIGEGFWNAFLMAWKRFDVEVERIIDHGDTVIVFMRETAQARHGGLELQNETAAIIKVRQQRIVEMTGYLDRDEALKAAEIKA